jgi:RIO kinase 1
MSAEQAREDHELVMHFVMCMLNAGLVHGDLSEFNVLVDEQGPVVIDLPQAVDAAANNNAQTMLERDVKNMTDYYGLFAPDLLNSHYAQEIWALYEDGKLHPDLKLTGEFEMDTHSADVDSVMLEIKAALDEEESRKERLREADAAD